MKEIIKLYEFEELTQNQNEKPILVINNIIDEIRIIITGLIGIKDDFDVSNLLEFKDKYLKNTEKIEELSNLSLIDIFNFEQIELIGAYEVERYYSSIYGTPNNFPKEEELNLKIAEELYFINNLIHKLSSRKDKYEFILEVNNKK